MSTRTITTTTQRNESILVQKSISSKIYTSSIPSIGLDGISKLRSQMELRNLIQYTRENNRVPKWKIISVYNGFNIQTRRVRVN